MNDLLYPSLIDVEKYPIHNLTSSAGQRLLKQCRVELEQDGLCHLPKFMKDDAVAETVAQKNFLSMHDFASENEHNVYFTPPDLSLHPLHPLRQQLRSRKKALAYDMIPPTAPLNILYESDDFLRFVGLVLGLDPFYRSSDPLDCLEIATFDPGDELSWHFDNSDFSVTLMLQPSDQGGILEYFPALRSEEDPNYEGVRRAMNGDLPGCRQFRPESGALALFRGRHALHRVTPVAGSGPRINAVLTYSDRPDMRLTPMTQKLFYGRNV
eukprot:TRINITY_DN17023_c0_g1_i1.p1 TRINITY_DN17023_c0_g1~~TRINITY_DN17023_c0_g1_i1.p1  ORF type:complete len:279 (+),score=34.94 TRINITY_DN17023_c0_g1_i1:34-837(+)